MKLTPAELTEMRAVLEAVSARIIEALIAWPPDIDLTELLAHELAYASHVADALEADARRRHEQTEAMQDHYSTVRPDEQRAAIAKVIDLAGVRRAKECVDDDGAPDAAGG